VLVSLLSVFAVTYWMSAVNERWNICRFAAASSFIISYLLCSVSLLTLPALSVDRLLRAQIQTSCNFKANMCNCNCFLACLNSRFNILPLELRYIFMVSRYRHTTVFSNFDLLLHKDFSHAASSSNGSVISPGDSKIL